MFLQASVILLTGAVCLSGCWDTTPWEQTHSPGADTHDARYGQRAGGTHPTGMQSSYIKIHNALMKLPSSAEQEISLI